MSDNIPPDLIEQELEARFRIPTEVWTDIFKMLPRRFLVQNISPACYRFKEICDKNVENIHVIKKAYEFHYKLGWDNPEANQQLGHLAGNDCHLASQFRMTFLSIRDEKSQAILRYCPELFNGCKIELRFYEENKNSTVFLGCLGLLEKAKPVQITVDQHEDQIIDFWHHPTFMNCTRVLVGLYFWPNMSTVTMTAIFVNIFDWLHHQPTEMDCNGIGNAVADQQVRCMIIKFNVREHVDWLLNRCSQNLQQSRGLIDRRPFVLAFGSRYWSGFGQFRQMENESTGEVLVIDRVLDENGRPTNYRLRRCLAGEEANGPEFYAGIFKRDGLYDSFNIDNEIPTVIIG